MLFIVGTQRRANGVSVTHHTHRLGDKCIIQPLQNQLTRPSRAAKPSTGAFVRMLWGTMDVPPWVEGAKCFSSTWSCAPGLQSVVKALNLPKLLAWVSACLQPVGRVPPLQTSFWVPPKGCGGCRVRATLGLAPARC